MKAKSLTIQEEAFLDKQINLTKTVMDLIVHSKFNSKMVARISICTLNPLKLPSSQNYIWCQFVVVASVDVTQPKAYWYSQKVVAYYENIIRILGACF